MNTVPATTPLAPLRLKKSEERRLRAGHLWVYSNEVDTAATPLKAFVPGQQVQLLAHNGKSLGMAYVNPNSLICARLVSRDAGYLLDRSLLVHRLNVALALRERLFRAPFYRLVYGEADQLPGLVIDRYGEVCVVQCTTAGMEAVKDEVLAALDKVLHPAGVLWRADSPVRQLEGLDSYREVHGNVPGHVDLVEHGVRFRVSLLEGQKTGWFYDQRMNRARLHNYVAGQRVLDVFSYVSCASISRSSTWWCWTRRRSSSGKKTPKRASRPITASINWACSCCPGTACWSRRPVRSISPSRSCRPFCSSPPGTSIAACRSWSAVTRRRIIRCTRQSRKPAI
jgi:hypothetical protein